MNVEEIDIFAILSLSKKEFLFRLFKMSKSLLMVI